MIVDCDRCEVRGDACTDCVITVLLGALAEAGMVPQLRLVPSGTTDAHPPLDAARAVAGWTDESAERSDQEAV